MPSPATIGQENPAVAANSEQALPPLPNPQSAPPASESLRARPHSAVTPDAVIMNSRSFGIPFNIDSAGNQPKEVQLLVSRGDSNWELLDRKPPQVRQFQFQGTGRRTVLVRDPHGGFAGQSVSQRSAEASVEGLYRHHQTGRHVGCRSGCFRSRGCCHATEGRDTDQECSASLRYGRRPRMADR